MKTYTLSFAASLDHKPEHPERTARRSLDFDVQFQVWPSRAAMLTTIRMQNRGVYNRRHWVACQWVCERCQCEHVLSGVQIVECPKFEVSA